MAAATGVAGGEGDEGKKQVNGVHQKCREVKEVNE